MLYRAGYVVNKSLGITMLALVAVSIFALSGVASWPNFATSTESASQLFFDGYVQCQPAYIENGHHAARGFFVYRNGLVGEQWAFTPFGQSAEDGSILSVSMRYLDTLNPWAPAVTFNYGFDWVPFGSGKWVNVSPENQVETVDERTE